VISQISHDYGAEIRYENSAPLGSLDNRFTLGFQPAYESLLNKQYQNNLGEHGALTKDQHDQASTLALYAGAYQKSAAAELGKAAFDAVERHRSDQRLQDDLTVLVLSRLA